MKLWSKNRFSTACYLLIDMSTRVIQSRAIIKNCLQNLPMIFVLVKSANNLFNFGFHNAGSQNVLVNEIMETRKKKPHLLAGR